MTDRPADLPRRKRAPVPAPDHGSGADPAVPTPTQTAARAPIVPPSTAAYVTLNVRISPATDLKLRQAMADLGLPNKRAAVERAIDMLYDADRL
jgi:hypothetical protein